MIPVEETEVKIFVFAIEIITIHKMKLTGNKSNTRF